MSKRNLHLLMFCGVLIAVATVLALLLAGTAAAGLTFAGLTVATLYFIGAVEGNANDDPY